MEFHGIELDRRIAAGADLMHDQGRPFVVPNPAGVPAAACSIGCASRMRGLGIASSGIEL